MPDHLKSENQLFRPDHPHLNGPLTVGEINWDDWRGTTDDRLLYASLDLMERDELRLKLGLPARDNGSEDASLVLAAYRRWREEAAQQLGGQFAYAMWDGQRQSVVAARDPLGLRPFHFARTPTGFAFGGSLRSLLERENISEQYDEHMLIVSLLERQPYSLHLLGRTCYREIDLLKPGHVMRAGPDNLDQQRYWTPEAASPVRFRKIEDYAAALRDLLQQVIAEHSDDETLGAHLSGGIDSSGIVALASRHRRETGLAPPVCFSWQPPPENEPEQEHEAIESVAEYCRSPLIYAPPEREDVLAELRLDRTRDPQQMFLHENPVRRHAKARGVRTVLSGWGGDQGVTFLWHKMVEYYLFRTGRWRALCNTMLRERGGWRRFLSTAIRGAPKLYLKSLERRRQQILHEGKESFLRSLLLEQAQLPILSEPERTPQAWMAYLLTDGSITCRADAWALAGAKDGIRYRYPFLDRRVVNFALGLPIELWARRGGRNRWPIREALSGLLPDQVRLGNFTRDPVRFERMRDRRRDVFAEVSPQICRQLDGQPLSDVIDLKRLRAEMQPERLDQRKRWEPLICVLDSMPFDV